MSSDPESLRVIRAVLETIAFLIVLAACLFGSAGTTRWLMGWVVLGVLASVAAASFVLVDSDLMRERAAPGPGVDRGDVVLAIFGALALYPGTLVTAGLDAIRFGRPGPIPPLAQIIALCVFCIGYGFALWAVRSNPFFATFVRIQHDRGHSVATSGPYRWVRHPGYAGALLAHLALPLALGSFWALLPAAAGTMLFIARTSREDVTLHDRLAGYREYQKRVRWRLVPGLW